MREQLELQPAGRVRLVGQRDRALHVVGGGVEGVQRVRAAGGPVQRRRGPGGAYGVGVDAERAGDLVGRPAVVGEHLGQVGVAAAGQRVEPVGGALVPGDPLGARQPLVADVADQHVAEPVLGLAGHRGRGLLVHEVALLQPAQRPLDGLDVAAQRRGDRAGPELTMPTTAAA